MYVPKLVPHTSVPYIKITKLYNIWCFIMCSFRKVNKSHRSEKDTILSNTRVPKTTVFKKTQLRHWIDQGAWL